MGLFSSKPKGREFGPAADRRNKKIKQKDTGVHFGRGKAPKQAQSKKWF